MSSLTLITWDPKFFMKISSKPILGNYNLPLSPRVVRAILEPWYQVKPKLWGAAGYRMLS